MAEPSETTHQEPASSQTEKEQAAEVAEQKPGATLDERQLDQVAGGFAKPGQSGAKSFAPPL